MKKVPIIRASDLTPEQKDELIVKDNIPYGEFDYDKLANNFDIGELQDWGLDLPQIGEDEEEKEQKPKSGEKESVICPKCGHEFEPE